MINFNEVGKAAEAGDHIARMYWAALGTLMTQPDFCHQTPEQVHAHLTQVGAAMYDPNFVPKERK